MSNSPKTPDKYVPEFCSAMIIQLKDDIQQITISLSNKINDFNEKFKEIFENILDVKKKNYEDNKNIYIKVSELEEIYHDIDKEMFKIKEIYKIITNQAKLNEEFHGQLLSIEKRLKLSFKFLFLLFSIFLTSSYFFINSIFGG